MRLLLVLIFLSESAVAAELSCKASLNGEEILQDKIEVIVG